MSLSSLTDRRVCDRHKLPRYDNKRLLFCVVTYQDGPEALPGGPGVLRASHPVRPEERGGYPSDSRHITLLGDHLDGYLQKARPRTHTCTVRFSWLLGTLPEDLP